MIRYDQRGTGASDWMPAWRRAHPYALVDMAADATAALDALRVERAHVIGLSLGGPTGYAINPARDLGPRIAHAILPIAGKGSSDWEYSWIPVIAPIIGALISAGLFVLLGFGG